MASSVISSLPSQLWSITTLWPVSFTTPLRIGGWVDLHCLSHFKLVYLQMALVIHLRTKWSQYVLSVILCALPLPLENNNYNRFTTLCLGLPGWVGTRRIHHSGFCWSRHDWLAVASAEPYASYLHFAPEDNQASTSIVRFYGLDALPDTKPAASKHWRPKAPKAYDPYTYK